MNNEIYAQQQHIYEVKNKTHNIHTTKHVDVVEDYLNIGVIGKDFNVIFSKQKGLVSYRYHQQEYIRVSVRPNFFRAATNNDVENNKDFEFTALHYTPYELENARHKDELPNIYQTVLCINEKQMGIAGDDTWGAKTHDEFLLDKEKHHLRFSFKGK